MSNENNAKDIMRSDTNSPINEEHGLKIKEEFLKILRDNAFNGMDGGDIINHISKILEIIEWIKIPSVDKNELRLLVFLKSLSGDAKKCKVSNDLDDGTYYLDFLYWLALKFDNFWEIDKNTRNGLWEFYVNERTKGTIGDLDDEPCNESYKKTCSDTFYKPYLDAQEAKDMYEVIDREYSLIPIPACHDIDNPDELCRTKEFTVNELLAACLASTTNSSAEKIADGRNYGLTCEDEAKRRNSRTKTKTFEENGYLLLYAVSSKEDTAYQRQLITRIQ
nr:hypothetical protein [Tanacetum cinerariifolium]